jgi:hypothetical protein
MTTVRQIERWWNAGEYARLGRELLVSRLEDAPQLRQACASAVPAAALAMIRLDELNQSHAPLYARLLRRVLAAQEADGGWSDPLTTALVLRALLGCQGTGPAVDGALSYLAALQKEDGAWPAESFRRMPPDAFVTALILHELADEPRFQEAAHPDAALAYLDNHASEDAVARRLHGHLAVRRNSVAMQCSN